LVSAVLCSCFDRFFRHVNLKENKLISKRRGGFFMDDLNLIGVDYLWRVRMICIFSAAAAGLLLLPARMLPVGIVIGGICESVRLSAGNLENYLAEVDVTW